MILLRFRHKLRLTIPSLSLLIFVTGGVPFYSSYAADLDYRVGIGYEFISQEFFLDSIIGGDSLAAAAALRTTYLDDYKGLISVRYLPFEDRRLELRASYEQTPEFIRGKLFGDFRPTLGQSRLNWNWEFDVREKYDGIEKAGDSYLSGSTRAKLAIPASQSLSLVYQIQSDFVSFDLSDDFSQDYYRIGGKFGLVHRSESFSSLSGNLFMLGRIVPDSTFLNYLSFGGEFNYFGFYEKGSLDLLTRIERRDYNQPEAEDDFIRIDADARHTLKLGEKYLLRQELDGELAFFDESELVNFNYQRGRLSLLAGLQSGGWTVLAGPQIELKRESEIEFSQGEDYNEYALKISLDFFTLGGIFGSVESVTGSRNLADQIELQSDFRFQRLLLIGDSKVYGEIHFNILLSAEWEFHDQSEENNQIMLLSSNLTWGF